MNANEFADELEKAPTLWFKDDIAGKWIIEKLRQQQEQIDKLTAIVALREMDIAALKQTIDANNLSQNIGQFVKPVKELTDEEIDNISDEIPHYIDTYMGRRMFARAILIKAQEK